MTEQRTRRPGANRDGTEEEGTDGRGRDPSNGYAAKINQAHKAAPDGAVQDDVQAVAVRAYQEGLDVRKVWAEYVDDHRSEFSEVDQDH